MERRFKFKSLSVYSSDEWMANSTKRYRKVFDKTETTYIRCELALYNKLFDEEDWETKVTIRCEKVIPGANEKICELETDLKVSKDDNIAYIRDGWGNAEPGIFWKKGTYKWLAIINEIVVGEQQFFIEDVGFVTNNNNPYFSIEHIKLFAGDFNGYQTRHRKYLKTFNKTSTQYIWAEIKIKVITNSDFNYELFLNYIDDAGQAKAHQSKTGYIDSNKSNYTYTLDLGWGHDTAGSWKDDKYSLEVVFMDALIGAVTFECKDNEEEEGIPELITSIEQTLVSSVNNTNNSNTANASAPDKSLEELIEDVQKLIGLEKIKTKLHENITYLKFTKLRKEKGFNDSDKLSLHSVFTGNPGTGKTTIVKMLGKIYYKMGLLSKGHVNEVDRAALVGEFIGQTAPKVKKAIDDARGGILFIDEAYSLSRAGDDSKDFGKEVIEILLKEMSDGPGDIAIIAAGYPKEMESFIESNPGLKSRFTDFFHFEDYLPEELYQIALYAAGNKQLSFSPEADAFLKEQLIESYRKRDKSFGNARFINGIVDEAKQNLGVRIMKSGNLEGLSNQDLSEIKLEDLKQVFTGSENKKLKININEKDLQLALAELNDLIGMDNIKQELNELVKLIRFYNETGKDVVNKFSLHAVFTGNPGTGKTTLARIIAKIYKALGLLERGHIIEVDREGLVAGYVGQTAIKTQEKVENAMGGILFIDEAYALGEGSGQNDFGKEAVEVILKRMEDKRGKFGVIAAGYPDNMQRFIEMNPGLKSRFDKTFHFYDYNSDQLLQIAGDIIKKEGLNMSADAAQHLKIYFDALHEKRDKFFGNARTVRQTIAEVVMKQNLRLASMPASQRTSETLSELTTEDVKHLQVKDEDKKQNLGFRFGSAG